MIRKLIALVFIVATAVAGQTQFDRLSGQAISAPQNSTAPVQIGSVWYPGTASGLVTAPIVAPGTSVTGSGGSVAAATYYCKYTYKNFNGETTGSPASTIVVAAPNSIVYVGDGGGSDWGWTTGAYGYRVYCSTTSGGTYYLQTPAPVVDDFMVDTYTHYVRLGTVGARLTSLTFAGTVLPTSNTAAIDPLQVALNATKRSSSDPTHFGTLFIPAIDSTVNPGGQFIMTTPLIVYKGSEITGSGGQQTDVNSQSRILGSASWNNAKLGAVMTWGADYSLEKVGIQGVSSNGLMNFGGHGLQGGHNPTVVKQVSLRAPSPVVSGIQVATFKAAAGAAYVNGSNSGLLVQSGVTSKATSAMNVTAGNLLVCLARWGGAAPPPQTITSVTDTAGNVYSSLTKFTYSTEAIQLWYVLNAAANAANVFTINFSASANFVAVECDQFSGVDAAAALDDTATGTAFGNLITSGLFTTTTGDQLIYAGLEANSSASQWTAGSGYTIAQAAAGGNGIALGSQYQVVTTVQTDVTATASNGIVNSSPLVNVGILYDMFFHDLHLNGGYYNVEYRNAAGGEHYYERGRWDANEGFVRNVPGWMDPDLGTNPQCGAGGFCNGVGRVEVRDVRTEGGSGELWVVTNLNFTLDNVEIADPTVRAGTLCALRMGSVNNSGAAGSSLTIINTSPGSSAQYGIYVDGTGNQTFIQLQGTGSPGSGTLGAINANNIQLLLSMDPLAPGASTFSAGNPLSPVASSIINPGTYSVYSGGGSGANQVASGGQWFNIPDRLVFNYHIGNTQWYLPQRVSLRNSAGALTLYGENDTTAFLTVPALTTSSETNKISTFVNGLRVGTGATNPFLAIGATAATPTHTSFNGLGLRNNDIIVWKDAAGTGNILGWRVNTSNEMESQAALGIMPLANATPFGKAGKAWAPVFTSMTTGGAVTLNGSVSQGTAFKFASITTGSINASASAAVTLTFSGVFTNAAWMPVCSVLEATASTVTLRLHHIESITNTTNATVVVRVVNDDGGGAHTGTLYCTGTSGP